MELKTADKKQIDLIGYSIDDFVEKDSKSRFIVEIVDELDIFLSHPLMPNKYRVYPGFIEGLSD